MVSDEASSCVKCGYPIKKDRKKKPSANNAWSAVSKSRTPINVFALAMMACAAILGGSATQIDNVCDLTAFTYTLHIFLALCAMFFATILFSRKGIYHPEDLAKAKQADVDDLGHDRPIVAAILICLMVFGYAVYQWHVNNSIAKSMEKNKVLPTICVTQPKESEEKGSE
ncbi:MAG: hypothetical protein QNJ78_08415 [Gammaproteobacteria bacterium]|nr:hypothetical protein [Gammaproteobacteria bacterium]